MPNRDDYLREINEARKFLEHTLAVNLGTAAAFAITTALDRYIDARAEFAVFADKQ